MILRDSVGKKHIITEQDMVTQQFIVLRNLFLMHRSELMSDSIVKDVVQENSLNVVNAIN